MAEQILKTEYSEIMQKSYIDYAMSVICARALPDIRDGLKPVQRRVLYAMDQLGLNHDKPHRKSARIVGDTMGKFHPHGDSSIYEALVVLEQDFKKGMALVDGHGNFGSIEGDGAAAMRYTEAKLKKFTQEVYLADLDKDVVNFLPNFDETEREPEVLPVKVPNILINGAEGIAVGMTTNIPTHNLSEVVDAVTAYMKNNEITTGQLMKYVTGPDFPTGGIVVNASELGQIYESGTGKIKVRGKLEYEPAAKKADKDRLVITEIPYTMIGANIGKFISDMYELVENKTLSDITDITNESSKEGIRIVLELRKGADAEKIKNILYKKTKLQDTFGVNMLAIVDGKPETLGLKDIIRENVKFQYETTRRKYEYLLNRELEQKEIKEGLIKACNIIDLIIEILRGSQSLKDAKACLISGDTSKIKFRNPESAIYAGELHFTEKQAQAILDLRLYRLIGLEILALEKDYEDLVNRIAAYEDILDNRESMTKVIIKELAEIKKKYGVERKTLIEDAQEIVLEPEVQKPVRMAFMMDRFGYARLADLSVYDKNRETMEKENRYVFTCMSDDFICVFTDNGTLHRIRVKDVPLGKLRDKGKPIDNICNYDSSRESYIAVLPSEAMSGKKLLFATALGMAKIVDGAEFDVSKRTVAATKLTEGDAVVNITLVENEAAAGAEYGTYAEITGFDGGQDDYDFGDASQGSFDFDGDGGLIIRSEDKAEEQTGFFTEKLVVFKTAENMFLKFPLIEIPEKKKGAIGVRALKLGKNDRVSEVYVMDAGDNVEVLVGESTVNLRNLTTKKRDQAAQKAKK